jgi:hypothetical protein
VGNVVTVAGTTPDEVKEAQVELAIYFADNGSFTGSGGVSTGGPDSIKVGSIELDGLNDLNAQTITISGQAVPVMVSSLIGHLLGTTGLGSGLWRPTWRAW